jgi:hypothetical protein
MGIELEDRDNSIPHRTDDELKQECELQATKIILRILKKKLGKLPVTFLTDSLYANEAKGVIIK